MRPWHSLFCLPDCHPLRATSVSISVWVSAVPTALSWVLPRFSRQTVSLAGSPPLTGRQAEFFNYQSPRRRTGYSRGAQYSSFAPNVRNKGIQNRRFWHAFAYFSRGRKVGRGSGLEAPRGRGRAAPGAIFHRRSSRNLNQELMSWSFLFHRIYDKIFRKGGKNPYGKHPDLR